MIEQALIICDGNVCRSPMTGALLSRAVPNLAVRSAGLMALAGRPAARLAIDVMARRGIALCGHVAQQIHLGHVRESALILAMTNAQCRELERRYPFARGRVFQLDQTTKQDIPDPFGKSEAVFEMVARHIEHALEHWVARVGATETRGVAN